MLGFIYFVVAATNESNKFMKIKYKRIIAKEGLVLMSVICISAILLFVSDILLEDEYTIFNLQGTYNGESQKFDIVSYIGKPGRLKASLWKNFVENSSQNFTEKEKELANWRFPKTGRWPTGFVVTNLPRSFSELGLLKRVIINLYILILFAYSIYIFTRYYFWYKKVKKDPPFSGIKLVKEGLMVIYSLYLWIFISSLDFLTVTLDDIFGSTLVYPTQQSEFIKAMGRDFKILFAIYILMQVIRFIMWAMATLKKGNKNC